MPETGAPAPINDFPDAAPEGFEWVCSLCGNHAKKRSSLKGGVFPCDEEAVLCRIGSGASLDYDVIEQARCFDPTQQERR